MSRVEKIACIIAMLLSDAMCAVVAYQYCELKNGAIYKGYSAPPQAAFMWVVPFLIGIMICLGIAEKFKKKERGGKDNDK